MGINVQRWIDASAAKTTFALSKYFAPSGDIALFIHHQDSGRIGRAQLQLYIDQAEDIQSRYNMTPVFIYEKDVSSLPALLLNRVKWIGVQTHFDVSKDEYEALLEPVLSAAPSAPVIHMDWSAPTDLRQASAVMHIATRYMKKHVLKDRSAYEAQAFGDTNLMDHYVRRFNLIPSLTETVLPDQFWSKFILAPTFYTERPLRRLFEATVTAPNSDDREIDIHSRLATEGTAWYQTMREEALKAVSNLSEISALTDFPVPLPQFMHELQRSKMGFSPFGYGEICWRDFETLAAGSLLIKPDCDHIELAPNMLRANETYVPLKWDFSDLAEKVNYYKLHEKERRAIVDTGFHMIKSYFAEKQFMHHFDDLFSIRAS